MSHSAWLRWEPKVTKSPKDIPVGGSFDTWSTDCKSMSISAGLRCFAWGFSRGPGCNDGDICVRPQSSRKVVFLCFQEQLFSQARFGNAKDSSLTCCFASHSSHVMTSKTETYSSRAPTLICIYCWDQVQRSLQSLRETTKPCISTESNYQNCVR